MRIQEFVIAQYILGACDQLSSLFQQEVWPLCTGVADLTGNCVYVSSLIQRMARRYQRARYRLSGDRMGQKPLQRTETAVLHQEGAPVCLHGLCAGLPAQYSRKIEQKEAARRDERTYTGRSRDRRKIQTESAILNMRGLLWNLFCSQQLLPAVRHALR